MNRTVLILLHGLPATGKTSIGSRIGERLALPFFSKDFFKESMHDAMEIGEVDLDWSRRLGRASIEMTCRIVEQLLAAGVSCIAETCWTPELAEPFFAKMLERYRVDLVQIFVWSRPDIRIERFRERSDNDRHPVHADGQRLQGENLYREDASEKNRPLNLKGDLIEVDTTDFGTVDLDAIVEQIQRELDQRN